MLVLHEIVYRHPDQQQLFNGVNLSLGKGDKGALIGVNGSGKSTLLKIIAGQLQPSGGQVQTQQPAYYVPQVLDQYDHLTLGQALGVSRKLDALDAIVQGQMDEAQVDALADDWTIVERCTQAMRQWQLPDTSWKGKLGDLSGGQKTKVFLAGIAIHRPDLLLLDEPSNHLDEPSRKQLYRLVESLKATILVVSHDRKLLNLLPAVYELSTKGVSAFGGNYEAYAAQKQVQTKALRQDIRNSARALQQSREAGRIARERQQKSDLRGKRKQKQAGVARIMMRTMRNKAEKSTAKSQQVHAEKSQQQHQELRQLQAALPMVDQIQFVWKDATVHTGKVLFSGQDINCSLDGHPLWPAPLALTILSGERIALKGANGSGKTSLLKIILGTLVPTHRSLHRARPTVYYLDQTYRFHDPSQNILETAGRYNQTALHTHEVTTRLTQFLFKKADWNKQVCCLSGGERMRLMLCCLTLNEQAPDMIILDEPTNNLDMENVEVLTAVLRAYHGTLIVVSHDAYFLEQIEMTRTVALERNPHAGA